MDSKWRILIEPLSLLYVSTVFIALPQLYGIILLWASDPLNRLQFNVTICLDTCEWGFQTNFTENKHFQLNHYYTFFFILCHFEKIMSKRNNFILLPLYFLSYFGMKKNNFFLIPLYCAFNFLTLLSATNSRLIINSCSNSICRFYFIFPLCAFTIFRNANCLLQQAN